MSVSVSADKKKRIFEVLVKQRMQHCVLKSTIKSCDNITSLSLSGGRLMMELSPSAVNNLPVTYVYLVPFSSNFYALCCDSQFVTHRQLTTSTRQHSHTSLSTDEDFWKSSRSSTTGTHAFLQSYTRTSMSLWNQLYWHLDCRQSDDYFSAVSEFLFACLTNQTRRTNGVACHRHDGAQI